MKRKVSFMLAGLLLFGYVALAQGYTFRVMVTKGDNKVKTAGSTDWQAVRIGGKLNDGDEIMIAEGGYMGLVHASGKTKELKSAGTYKVSDLSSELSASSANIASKYADYVISKMSPEEREANRRKYASVTGAVSRGTEGTINLYMPSSVTVYNPKVVLRWEPVENASAYEIKLKDLFEQTIMVAESDKPYYVLDLQDPKLREKVVEGLVIITVNVKGNEDIKSGDAAIELASKDEGLPYEVDLQELKANLNEDSAINSIILAEFYEENNLLLDALTAYEHAIKLEPDVEFYKQAYEDFLMRQGLKKNEAQ